MLTLKLGSVYAQGQGLQAFVRGATVSRLVFRCLLQRFYLVGLTHVQFMLVSHSAVLAMAPRLIVSLATSEALLGSCGLEIEGCLGGGMVGIDVECEGHRWFLL